MRGTDDTIFAAASSPGRAAVTLLRISGPRAGTLLAGLAGSLPPPRVATLRTLRDAAGEALDRALTLWFPAPGSYTGEDCAELHLHGGRAVLLGVSEALAAAGARPADPGECTRRAFLNGKMDLIAAEAVADLVDAETAGQRRQALQQLDGNLGALYRGWADRLTHLLAWQEALIDFPDEDLPPETVAVLRFSGTPSPDAVAARTGELVKALAASAWQPAGAPVAWFYDPPWTIPSLRRNEVAVPVSPR